MQIGPGRLGDGASGATGGPRYRNARIAGVADSVGATAHMTIVEGNEALAAVVVEPTRSDVHVAYRMGARHPLESGAAGRAILAARTAGGPPTRSTMDRCDE
jgi:DNA-binding IclR family transcriptional regulator